MNDFKDKLYHEIKHTYSLNNSSLINLSDVEFLKQLGYPQNFIYNHRNLFNYAFPIIFPFDDIVIKDKTILDLGCGIGIDSLFAGENGAKKVFAVDLSKSFIYQGVENKKVYKIVGNIENLFFKPNSFDIVVFNGSINLILDKKPLLEQINVILKKNGIIIIGDLFWVGESSERDIYRNDINSWCWCVGGCLTEEELFNIANATGFKIVAKKHFEIIDNFIRAKYILKNER